MNNASTEACAKTTSVPTTNMTKMIGINPYFLRTRMNAQSARARLTLLMVPSSACS